MKQRHLIFFGVAGLWVAGLVGYGLTTELGQNQSIAESIGQSIGSLWIPAIVFYLGYYIHDKTKPKISKLSV